MVTIEHNNNPTIIQSQTIVAQGRKSCLQLTTMDLNNFKMAEDIIRYHEDLPGTDRPVI
jgi:hypothetical protein